MLVSIPPAVAPFFDPLLPVGVGAFLAEFPWKTGVEQTLRHKRPTTCSHQGLKFAGFR